MRRYLYLLVLLSGCSLAAGTGGINDPSVRDRPYIVLVSLDGFRHDFQDRYETPALDRLAKGGVRAEALIPVFPTLTFPNHYSIATGLYPAEHGILGNTFASKTRDGWYSMYDRDAVGDGRWYGGNPVWTLAEQNGMVAAAFFFVGTEAAVNGVRPSHWRAFDASIAGGDRVRQVLDWLALPDERRPHVITLYFEDVDTAAHDHGPDAPQTAAAVTRVDGYVGQLLDGIAELPIAARTYVVIVSDHGLARYRDESPFFVDSAVELDEVMTVDHGSLAFLYFPSPDTARARRISDAINAAWEHGTAYLPSDAPDEWKIGVDSGFADIIVQADAGYAVFSSADNGSVSSVGDHGWPPEAETMHGIFLATGPRLPSDVLVPPIRAVDVYPLMTSLLGLPVDGRAKNRGEALLQLLE